MYIRNKEMNKFTDTETLKLVIINKHLFKGVFLCEKSYFATHLKTFLYAVTKKFGK